MEQAVNGADAVQVPHDAPTSSSTTTDAPQRQASDSAASQAKNNILANKHLRSVTALDDIFNPREPRIKEDIIRMIVQYLSDEGYQASKMTVQDEANVRAMEHDEHRMDMRRLRKAILEGDWQEVDKLVMKPFVKTHKSFLYAIYKQQYLEYIEHHEIQKAFTFLNKRIKPLENLQTTAQEFRDLCYLLTAKSVHDAPSFKNWEGIALGREKLVEQLQDMVDFEQLDRNSTVKHIFTYVPPGRLLHLMRQAAAYQVDFARYHPRVAPKLTTLLQDYTSYVIPNAVHRTFAGHRANVKCVDFVGEQGAYIASGSSDNTVRLWETESGQCVDVLRGHTSRIWSVAATRDASLLTSASGDGTVRLWDLARLRQQGEAADVGSGSSSSSNSNNVATTSQQSLQSRQVDVESQGTLATCLATFHEHTGDVYAAKFHPGEKHIVTAGYDKAVRLFDISTGQLVKTFSGHQLSVSQAIFNPMGNLIVSGSKDSTVRFWDVVSGLCIKTITAHLGEVTGVEMNTTGTLLLSSCKDNSNRLWDIRMLRSVRRFKGHQNTSKNFIRASFAHNNLVAGGSEDGVVYIWDMDTGDVLQRLYPGRQETPGRTVKPAFAARSPGIVYDVRWNSKASLFVSCGDDTMVRTWWYDASRPLDVEQPTTNGTQ
ncbi:hypothetical protein RI367_007383 [Sorochytrium milnesiophthora]